MEEAGERAGVEAEEGGGEGRGEDGEQGVLGGRDGGGAEHGWVVDGNYESKLGDMIFDAATDVICKSRE